MGRYFCGFRDGGSVWDDFPQDEKDAFQANGASMRRELDAIGRDRYLTKRVLGALKMPVTIAYKTTQWASSRTV